MVRICLQLIKMNCAYICAISRISQLNSFVSSSCFFLLLYSFPPRKISFSAIRFHIKFYVVHFKINFIRYACFILFFITCTSSISFEAFEYYYYYYYCFCFCVDILFFLCCASGFSSAILISGNLKLEQQHMNIKARNEIGN